MVSWLREGREKGKREQRRGAIKTLTSNLVYCVKKSHMHSRPREGPHAPVWPWWTLAPGLVPCPSQVRAELRCCCCWGGGGTFSQSAGAFVEGRWVDSRMTGERTPNASFQRKQQSIHSCLFWFSTNRIKSRCFDGQANTQF